MVLHILKYDLLLLPFLLWFPWVFHETTYTHQIDSRRLHTKLLLSIQRASVRGICCTMLHLLPGWLAIGCSRKQNFKPQWCLMVCCWQQDISKENPIPKIEYAFGLHTQHQSQMKVYRDSLPKMKIVNPGGDCYWVGGSSKIWLFYWFLPWNGQEMSQQIRNMEYQTHRENWIMSILN